MHELRDRIAELSPEGSSDEHGHGHGGGHGGKGNQNGMNNR